MRLAGRRKSTNVEDRRGRPSAAAVGGGGGILLLIVVVVAMLMGEDPQNLIPQGDAGPLVGLGGGAENAAPTRQLSPEEIAQGDFAAQVLALTEDVWNPLLAEYGVDYKEPTLVLFSRQVDSACGSASSATGPFYCPGDSKLYLDTSFFQQLSDDLQAPGDFARAYVIAHEVGHHIQNLLGRTDWMDNQRGSLSKEEMNALSVRLELQADFYAGVFAHHLRGKDRILEAGDIDEALECASRIGDDRLQKQARGYAVPETFTHGTSEQRKRWFRKGFETGDPAQGDTFSAERL